MICLREVHDSKRQMVGCFVADIKQVIDEDLITRRRRFDHEKKKIVNGILFIR